jgi:hypothetical protein
MSRIVRSAVNTTLQQDAAVREVKLSATKRTKTRSRQATTSGPGVVKRVCRERGPSADATSPPLLRRACSRGRR